MGHKVLGEARVILGVGGGLHQARLQLEGGEPSCWLAVSPGLAPYFTEPLGWEEAQSVGGWEGGEEKPWILFLCFLPFWEES